jgi:ligand-binding SRPBCC domain-containing protein
MKIYQLKRKQFLPITLEQAWRFFSTPNNLITITPPSMDFRVVYISGDETQLYAGQMINYRIRIFPGIVAGWTTEITHVKDSYRFVDEQRFGPYALWHHQHHFREVSGGIEMTDEVNYAIPLGWLGRLVHWLFVGKRVNDIFDYRYKVLENIFPG